MHRNSENRASSPQEGCCMKLFLIGAGIILEAVNVLVLYCALCVASRADRQMEEYDREQFFRKSEENI